MILETFYYSVRSIVLWFESTFRPNELSFFCHILIMLLMFIPSFFLNKDKRTTVVILFFAYILTMGFFDKVWADDLVEEKSLNVASKLYYTRIADNNFYESMHFMNMAQRILILDVDFDEEEAIVGLFATAGSCLLGNPAGKITVFISVLAAKYGNRALKNYWLVEEYLDRAQQYLDNYNFYCDILRTE